MTDATRSPGWHGAMLKLLRAGDYRLAVTGRVGSVRTTFG